MKRWVDKVDIDLKIFNRIVLAYIQLIIICQFYIRKEDYCVPLIDKVSIELLPLFSYEISLNHEDFSV